MRNPQLASSIMNKRSYTVFALVAGLLILAGCGSSGRLRYDSPREAYEKGMALYEEGKYDRAAEYFRGVFDFGRTNEYAADAQFFLAKAYYEDDSYILAASEFERFRELYRQDPRAEEAAFQRALAFYQLSPQFSLDQTETKRALDEFILFANRYPSSDLVPEANAYVLELRNKLARKHYEAAGLYERRELFEAAAITYETVFDRYPDTPWADDALVGAMRNYIAFSEQSVQQRQAERLQKAVDNYDRLIQIFPDSPLLKDAEALYTVAQARLQDLDGATAANNLGR